MHVYKELLTLTYHIPLTGEKPASLLFIGVPGVGKSHMLCHHRASNCLFLSDVTAAGIETILDKFDSNPEFSYIVCPDLIAALSRGNRNKRLISFMNVALEEGVTAIVRKDDSWKTRNGGAHVGLIGAVTTKEFRFNYTLLQGTGFLSRSLLINFDPEVDNIAEEMARGKKAEGSEVQIPRELIHVNTDIPEVVERIRRYSKPWAASEGEKELRKVKVIRRYTMARAILRDGLANKTVNATPEDVEYVWNLLRETRFNLSNSAEGNNRERGRSERGYDDRQRSYRPRRDVPGTGGGGNFF